MIRGKQQWRTFSFSPDRQQDVSTNEDIILVQTYGLPDIEPIVHLCVCRALPFGENMNSFGPLDACGRQSGDTHLKSRHRAGDQAIYYKRIYLRLLLHDSIQQVRLPTCAMDPSDGRRPHVRPPAIRPARPVRAACYSK